MTGGCAIVCDNPHLERRLELGDLLGHDLLGHRVVKILARAGIFTSEQLATIPQDSLKNLPSMGVKGLARIATALKETS